MPAVSIEVSDRLVEAMRRYELPISDICSNALEREVAACLPVMQMTPQARHMLTLAAECSATLGQNYVGVEHLVLAIINNRTITAQILDHLGVSERLRAHLMECLTANWESSNAVVNDEGDVLAYLVTTEDQQGVETIGLDGQKVRLVKDGSGRTEILDEAGQRRAPVPSNTAPRVVALDNGGAAVVVVDSSGKHTGVNPD